MTALNFVVVFKIKIDKQDSYFFCKQLQGNKGRMVTNEDKPYC